MVSADTTTPRPLSLIAEVTHRCPLRCVYCSNPLQLAAAQNELSADDWKRAITQAAGLGVLHLHLTGGEPLLRRDLADLIAAGRDANLYVNLITSAIGLTEERLSTLVNAGLEHIQVSFQDADEQGANHIAGVPTHARKLAIMPMIKRFPIALTINLVVHRMNLDRLPQMIAMAESFTPDRIEIAHVQYYGWAFKNRAHLMPTPSQVESSATIIEAAQQRLRGRIRVDAVTPDYYASYPKACMGGWGRQTLLIDPTGRVLPCHSAGVIPNMQFENVRQSALASIWRDSDAFRRFRQESSWPDLCTSCDRRNIDFGGCRCQALMLTGDAQAVDPVCRYSEQHPTLIQLHSEQTNTAMSYRSNLVQDTTPAARD